MGLLLGASRQTRGHRPRPLIVKAFPNTNAFAAENLFGWFVAGSGCGPVRGSEPDVLSNRSSLTGRAASTVRDVEACALRVVESGRFRSGPRGGRLCNRGA